MIEEEKMRRKTGNKSLMQLNNIYMVGGTINIKGW